MTLIKDKDLMDVLLSGENEDIEYLIDIITDSGKGRISLSDQVCSQLCVRDGQNIDEYVRALVAEELSRYGGNSIMNILRGGLGVSYMEILEDVAKHFGIKNVKGHSCAHTEMLVITKLLEHSVSRMSDEDKSLLFETIGFRYVPGLGPASLAALIASIGTTGLHAYRLSALVTGSMMSGLVGRGLTVAGGNALSRGLSVLAGPIGWAITGIWTAFDLTSPAYRVTVPCVVHIGHMRLKLLMAKNFPEVNTRLLSCNDDFTNCM